MAAEYLDFDLCIEKTAEGYQAEVTEPLGGKASINFSLPFSDLELENFILKVGGRRRVMRGTASPEIEAAQAFGGRLFQTIFDNEVRGVLHSSMVEADQQGKGLRLRLRLDDAPELVDLPWEYLYNPDRGMFLSLSTKTPIVRYMDLSTSDEVLSVVAPLRILVIVSSPSDYEPLDVELEWKNLNNALAKLQEPTHKMVVLERMEEATLPALQRKLRNGPFHILHFIGHGVFDERTHDGALIFEDAHGKGMLVSGQYLGTLLHDHDSLRLVVLNACEGARSSTTDPFAGTAQCLVRLGIPAVIAMQFEVSDTAAITFAREFYGAVADRYPVDAALAEARKAIHGEATGVEWGTPVLYLRAANGQIFDVKGGPQQTGSVSSALPHSISSVAASAAHGAVAANARTTQMPVTNAPSAPQPDIQPEPSVMPRLRRLLRAGVARTLSIIGALTVFASMFLAVGWYFSEVTLECQVRAAGLNVRSGPGVVYDPPIHVLANGVQLTAIGRNADAQWLLIRTAMSQQGWVSAKTSSVTCTGDLAALSVMNAPPLPSASAIAATSMRPAVVASSAATSASSSPIPSGAATVIDQPLAAPLPRSVRFGDVVFTVTGATISSDPPTFSGFTPSATGGRAYAAINLSVYNALPQQSLLVNANQVKLQLGDGRIFDELSRWSAGLSADSTQETTLFYDVPQSASWQNAKLVIRVPGKEPAILALDGEVPTPTFPQPLAAGAAAIADLVSYRISSAVLDLDNEGVRADVGERFLVLSFQVLNERSGNILVGAQSFRLRVNDTPLAPVNSIGDAVQVRSVKRIKVVFVVPADATNAELQVGEVGGVTETIPVSLEPVVSPAASPAPTPSN